MFKQKFLVVVLLLMMMLLQACSDSATDPASAPQSMSNTEAALKTTQILSGSVTNVHQEFEDGVMIWEVKMTAPGGGELKFEYFAESGNLKEIHGLSPSFDYEVNPGMGLILYSAAKQAALAAQNGQITSWKLEEDESDTRWEYRFFITSDRDSEVRIDASNGDVVRIKS